MTNKKFRFFLGLCATHLGLTGLTLLSCALPTSPTSDPNNARVTIMLPELSSKPSFAVGETISMTLRFTNCRLITEVHVTVGDFYDTTFISNFCDSLEIPIIPKSTGSIAITASVLRSNKTRNESTAQLTITGVVPTIVGTSGSLLSIREGYACTLWVAAKGTGPLTYSWMRNGTTIPDSSKDTLTLFAMNAALTGTYICTVKNTWDSARSPGIKVELLPSNAPSAPPNLTRMKVEDGMMLVWDAVDGADRYYVYRDTAANTSVISFAQTTNGYLLIPDQGTHYYWVRTSKEGILSPPSRAVYTGLSKPVWDVDSISADLKEGDSLRIRLIGSVSYADNQGNLRFSLNDPSGKGSIKGDSEFVYFAGHLDAGIYYGKIIVSDGANPDTCTIVVRVAARYHTITALPATNGLVMFTPAGPRYRWGDTVSATTVAERGYELLHWTGGISALGASAKIVVTADTTIGAEFVAVKTCTELVPGSSIKEAIEEASRSSNRLEKLCPVPGRYDDNRLVIGGKVTIVIQK